MAPALGANLLNVRTDEQGRCRRMVGRVGVEPTTSRLSGVRSNHLSYRPPPSPFGYGGRARAAQRRLVRHGLWGRWRISRMKGHEDGGMFFGQEEECVSSSVR